MNEVTRVLSAIEQGEPHAAEKLLPLVYEELRALAAQKLAHETPGQTLQATALVHEAYLRLVDSNQIQRWDSRGHFFAAAAEAMRRILVNRARDKGRLKRGGGRKRRNFDQIAAIDDATPDDMVELSDALEKLARENPTCAELVKLRFFSGLNLADAAACLGISRRTADRLWAFARAWLFRALNTAEDFGSPESADNPP
jgi:RNA polymerase sigma factor (TIGR02999 family)